MKIGCEFHSFKEWFSFTEDDIDNMGEFALMFWRTYKRLIKKACLECIKVH